MSETYLRMCQHCLNQTVIIKDGCTESKCPICDEVNKIRWVPETYIESDTLHE